MIPAPFAKRTNFAHLGSRPTSFSPNFQTNQRVLQRHLFQGRREERQGRSEGFNSNAFKNKKGSLLFALGVGLASTFTLTYVLADEKKSKEKEEKEVQGSQEAEDASSTLPTYTRAEVAKHKTPETRVWVTYQGLVYDITDFVESHPGGKKILLAAGGPLEPFWSVYKMHNTQATKDLMEEYKIGKLESGGELEAAASASSVSESDAFANDPWRLPVLRVRSDKPFNAETPSDLLVAQFITPNELFYVRNHMPVPIVDPSTYQLEITGEGIRNPIKLSLTELKAKFPHHKITTTIQCAGNRRTDMSEVKPVNGLKWEAAAIGTAEWRGVKLRDVLQYAGFDVSQARHIQFEGLDHDEETHYGASIPVQKAMSEDGDVLLAFEMNGTELPRDHGFPVRVVVPGVVGARNVKWVGKIVASKEESKSFWQARDYKVYPASVTNWQKVNPDIAPAVQELPVLSAICEPAHGSVVPQEAETITTRGYAWSGGGKGISRVEVSMDGGQNWQLAKLIRNGGEKEEEPQIYSKNWAWTLWEADLPLPSASSSPLKVCCRAVDSAQNVQPESAAAVWNVRGFCCNSYHCISVSREADGGVQKQ